MKLVDLVRYFRNGGSYDNFCRLQSLDVNSEVIEIYMLGPVNLDSELAFFAIEDTEGKIEYVFNDKTYSNLFDFYIFQDSIEEFKTNGDSAITDEEIACRLLMYGLNDA